MDPYLFKRLWRRPWLSLCGLLLSGVLCFLLCFLSGYQQEQEAKLEDIQDNFEVMCVVTNIAGTKSTGLRLPTGYLYFVSSPEFELNQYVKDIRMTKEFTASCMDLRLSDVMLMGVTSPQCADALNPSEGGGTDIWADNFYESNEMICLVSQEVYRTLGDQETVTLAVTDPSVYGIARDGSGRGNVDFRIVGTYNGQSGTIYMPFFAAQILGTEISKCGGVDSISFLAADNRKLEELSEAAALKFKPVDPLVSSPHKWDAALTIHDEQYNAMVAALEQNIERTRYLLPLISLLGLGVGFLISFLSTRGESITYALMRTLGMTKNRLLASVLREQLLLTVLAVAVISLLTGQFLPSLFYLICHTVGCFAAVIRSVRVAPTAILREQE